MPHGQLVYRTFDADTLVARGPIELFAVWITSSGVLTGAIAFYDNTAAVGDAAFQASAGAQGTVSLHVPVTIGPDGEDHGLLFAEGLFVDVGTGLFSMTVLYKVVPRESRGKPGP